MMESEERFGLHSNKNKIIKLKNTKERMAYSQNLRTLVIAPPKAASSSVIAALNSHGEELHNHKTLKTYLTLHNRVQNIVHAICFVRNPYERAYSLFRCRHVSNCPLYLSETTTFDAFLEAIVNYPDTAYTMPQHTYVELSDGSIPDYVHIYHIEDLNSWAACKTDLTNHVASFGKSPPDFLVDMPFLNKSGFENEDIHQYYTDNSYNMVESYYSKDFSTFDYSLLSSV